VGHIKSLRVMFLVQLLHNSNNFFKRSTIEYLWLTYRKTNLMIDYKKIKIKIKNMLKLYKNYIKIVQETLIISK
jgi:hypothetical protein